MSTDTFTRQDSEVEIFSGWNRLESLFESIRSAPLQEVDQLVREIRASHAGPWEDREGKMVLLPLFRKVIEMVLPVLPSGSSNGIATGLKVILKGHLEEIDQTQDQDFPIFQRRELRTGTIFTPTKLS